MATFTDLPIDVQDNIYRKKFNLELLDELKNLKEWWGSYGHNKFRPIEIGDSVRCMKQGATIGTAIVVRMTPKMVQLDNGRSVNKSQVRHILPTKKVRGYWNREYYMFDEGSVWSHPIAMKYPEFRDNYEATGIIMKHMTVMCNHPLAWLCFEVHNPDYIVHKKTSV